MFLFDVIEDFEVPDIDKWGDLISVDEESQPVSEKVSDTPPERIVLTAEEQQVCQAAHSLHMFEKSNEKYLQDGRYHRLLKRITKVYCDRSWSLREEPFWKETAGSLRISGNYERWTGHDETLTDTAVVLFRQLPQWVDTKGWPADDSWECEGMILQMDKAEREDNYGSYHHVYHKLWLLNKPFGLPGVWCMECKFTYTRD